MIRGEVCHHQRWNTNGVCKVLEDCPSAIQDLSVREYPQNCGFRGNLVIVCCPQAETTRNTTSTTIRPTTSTTITSTATLLTPIIELLPVGERAERGEVCHHQRWNTNGVCKVLEDCPSAIQDLSVKEYPQNCGFRGNLVIVCCPQAETTRNTTSTTIRPTTSTTITPNSSTTIPPTTSTTITPTTSTTITPTTSTTITPTTSTTITSTATLLTPIIELLPVGERAERGEVCHHQRWNTNGVCKVLEDCPSAMQDLSVREYPQNCGFRGNLVIVCCPQTGTTRNTTSTTIRPTPSTTIRPNFSTTITPTTSTTITPTTSTTITSTATLLAPIIELLPVGERAERACKHYHKLGLNVTAGYKANEDFPSSSKNFSHIFRGTPTIREEYPHMALLGYGTSDNYEYKCGGSLISDKFVLTAAHCLYTKFGEPQIVRLGDLNYTDPNDDQYVQQIKIKTLYKHPDYKPWPRYNDIGLLELEEPVTLHVYVKPACIRVNKCNEHEGIITGWGYTEHGKPSERLLKAIVDRFTPEICNKTYKNDKRNFPRGIDDNLQICYGSTDGQDTCQGDSGGPIHMFACNNVHCGYYIFGITSLGIGCGHATIPSVYVRVSYYIEWIESIVWP